MLWSITRAPQTKHVCPTLLITALLDLAKIRSNPKVRPAEGPQLPFLESRHCVPRICLSAKSLRFSLLLGTAYHLPDNEFEPASADGFIISAGRAIPDVFFYSDEPEMSERASYNIACLETPLPLSCTAANSTLAGCCTRSPRGHPKSG